MARPRTFSFFFCRVCSTCIDTLIVQACLNKREEKWMEREWSTPNPFAVALSTLLKYKFSLFAFSCSTFGDVDVQKILFVVVDGVESSLFSSLHYHPPTPSLINTRAYTFTHAQRSIRWGIEEHERDPACFGFFDSRIVKYVDARCRVVYELYIIVQVRACILLHDLERNARERESERAKNKILSRFSRWQRW